MTNVMLWAFRRQCRQGLTIAPATQAAAGLNLTLEVVPE
jgi:hypothetical protein